MASSAETAIRKFTYESYHRVILLWPGASVTPITHDECATASGISASVVEWQFLGAFRTDCNWAYCVEKLSDHFFVGKNRIVMR